MSGISKAGLEPQAVRRGLGGTRRWLRGARGTRKRPPHLGVSHVEAVAVVPLCNLGARDGQPQVPERLRLRGGSRGRGVRTIGTRSRRPALPPPRAFTPGFNSAGLQPWRQGYPCAWIRICEYAQPQRDTFASSWRTVSSSSPRMLPKRMERMVAIGSERLSIFTSCVRPREEPCAVRPEPEILPVQSDRRGRRSRSEAMVQVGPHRRRELRVSGSSAGLVGSRSNNCQTPGG